MALFAITRKKPGAAPGTLEFVGERKTEHARITVIDYGPDSFNEKAVDTVEECLPYRDSESVSWINVTGLHDTHILARIGEHFGLHPLVLEDIVNVTQRPKLEDYEDYLYIVTRMLYIDPETNELATEQISFVLGKRYVLSFQEVSRDVFEPVRERGRRGKGRLRKLGPDYLAYTLLDAIVDNYFTILERFGEDIEALEERLVSDPTPELLQQVQRLKRESIYLRKSVWPLREVLSSLERGESRLINKGTRIFLRDVYDHTIQVIDAVESFRDMIAGLQDLYLSSISNKMNEVMKVLTIIATIFVPLTFVAGIYGMNFEFMPELKWKWSYIFFWGVIMAMGGSMVAFFRRRRWL